MIITNYTVNQTVFQSNKHKLINEAIHTTFKDESGVLDALTALGQTNKQLLVQKGINNPIKNDAEFDEVMERIYNAKTQNGHNLWLVKNEHLKHYPDASKTEIGLLPYCGENDSSYYINMYLSGRLYSDKIQKNWKGLLPQKESDCIDMIRVLDYSLKDLDKNYGKYKGIVFRQGYMGENTKQFISTTMNPSIAGQLKGNWFDFKPNAGFSVIRTKNGHNIYAFQKKMKNSYAETEEEILLPREATYKEIPPNLMDEELRRGRNALARKLFGGAGFVIDGKLKEFKGYTKKDLYNLIRVFDEV